jgi:hypothetical protein
MLLLWDELAAHWNDGDMHIVHDWINERWSRIIQESTSGERDVLARFLQAMAFAALAFHFAAERNEESAELFVEDALRTLPEFAPAYAGLHIGPILEGVRALRDRLDGKSQTLWLGAPPLSFQTNRIAV